MKAENTKLFKRPISLNEKLYLLAEKDNPPFCVQLIIEGKGNICLKSLKKASITASSANPGTRLKFAYSNGQPEWHDSMITPNVSVIDENEFLNIDLNEVSCLQKSFSPFDKATCEILVVQSSNPIFIFRAFHGVMDGKGVVYWAKDVFRCLRRESPVGTNSKSTDFEFVQSLNQNTSRNFVTPNHSSPFGKHSSHKSNHEIHSFRLKGKYHALVAKIAMILTRECVLSSSDTATFMIPVDLRRHDSNIQTTANLSYPLFFNIKNEDEWQIIHGRILKGLIDCDEINFNFLEDKISNIPFIVLKLGITLFKKILGYQKKHISTAIISHLGRVNFSEFSTNNFKVNRIYSVPVPTSLVPLSMTIVEGPDCVEVLFSAPKCFSSKSKQMIKNIQAYFVNTYKFDLEKVAALNSNKIIYARATTAYLEFYQYVIKTPNSNAIYEKTHQVTYKELDIMIDNIASELLDANVLPHDVVGILAEREIAAIAAMFAIIKIGAIFLPLDPANPPKRIKYILDDAKAVILINFVKIKIDFSQQLYLNNMTERKNKINFNHEISSEDLCYLIYTSGTTNGPKGVEVEHKSLLHYVYWARDVYNLTDSPHFALFTSLAFDLSLSSIFIPLLSGGAIHLYPEALNHEVVFDILNNSLINALKLTPTHLDLFKRLNISCATKKTLIVGGEQLKVSTAKNAFTTFLAESFLYNEYGPTEATVGCIFEIFNKDKNYPTSAVPIGVPAPNTEIYLLDDNLEIVLPGEEGQIYIAGDCLARGYRNRDEQTKQAFILGFNGKRLYKTGDLAVLTNDYTYLYLRRCDDQIKINGHRIELSEIEDEILKYSLVESCKVLIQDISDKKYIYSFIIFNDGYDEAKLISKLKKNLQQYMLPSRYIYLKNWPMTINAKVDVSKLFELSSKAVLRNVSASDYPADRKMHHLELELINIFSDILNIPQGEVRTQTSFLELGGDSLDLVELYSFICKKYFDQVKYDFDFVKFLEKTSIEQLSYEIIKSRNE